MKRVIRNTLLLCICMLTAALTACQATPDAPIVVQKDMEQMLEKADRPENGVREAAYRTFRRDDIRSLQRGLTGDSA